MKLGASKKRYATEDTEHVKWKRLEVFYENLFVRIAKSSLIPLLCDHNGESDSALRITFYPRSDEFKSAFYQLGPNLFDGAVHSTDVFEHTAGTIRAEKFYSIFSVRIPAVD